MNRLFSHNAGKKLALVVALLSSIAFGGISLERESLKYYAIPGQAFSVNIPANTGVSGLFSMITGPSWLTLTANGILFGTPSEQNLGANELFISVEVGKVEQLFHAVIHVGPVPAKDRFSFEVSVETIFKADLKELSGIAGEYTYTNLPEWLTGLPSGVLIGKPSATHVGASQISVDVIRNGVSHPFTVGLLVKGFPAGHVNTPMVVSAGQPVQFHVTEITHSNRPQLVYLPHWLTMAPNGWITGVPSYADRGHHLIRIELQDVTAIRVYQFWITVSVT